jgi:hypothetical protein
MNIRTRGVQARCKIATECPEASEKHVNSERASRRFCVTGSIDRRLRLEFLFFYCAIWSDLAGFSRRARVELARMTYQPA